MGRSQRCLATILGALCLGPIGPSSISFASEKVLSEETSVSVGVGFEYATGKYGTDTRTDFISVPVTFSVTPLERLSVDLVIPYVYQNNGTTVFGSTMPYRTQPGRGTAKSVEKGRFQSGPANQSAGGSAVSSNFNPAVSQSGLGDVTLTVDYGLFENSEYLVQPRITLYIKFPTADRDKGLGTGETDIGPGLSLGTWFDKLHLFLEGSYVIQGESDLYATNNYLSYRAGLGNRFNSRLYGAALVTGASPPADGSPAPCEARLKVLWRAFSRSSVECYFSKGLTEGSPEVGSGLSIYHNF